MTYLFDDKIRYDDSPNIDAFGNLRTNNPRLLAEYRYQYGVSTANSEFNDVQTTGGTITYDFSRNCVLLSANTANNSKSIRQTKQYHPYIAGTSNKYLITFKFDTAKANVQQYVGAYDDDNGIFLRLNGLTPQVGIRKGGVDNEVVSQSQWNLDRLDGSMNEYNKSGVTIDFTKCQILTFDYQWLGVGRVRIGFVTDGSITYVHEFAHVNRTTETYMHQPSLPVRHEVKNVGVSASNTQLMAICSAVYCEGSDYETGYTRSISTDGTSTTVSNTTDGQLILAIRLKNGSFGGHKNHTFARLKSWSLFATNDVQYKVVLLPKASGYISGTPTWTSVSDRSFCEFTQNGAMVAGWKNLGNYDVIQDDFAVGAIGSSSGTNLITSEENKNNIICQNYDSTDSEVFAIVVYKLASNSDVKASLNWLEVK